VIGCGCMGGLGVLLACNSDLMVIESVFAVHAFEAVLAISSLLSSWPNFNRTEQSLLNSATKCSSGHLGVWLRVSALVCSVCPMSLVWLELLELTKGRSGVA
jgi:hypothetical protein